MDPYYEFEHIWPNDIKKLHLSKKKEIEHENSKHKLGNLTIATKPWNASWGNSPFETKRKHYEGSLFRVQQNLKYYQHWGIEQIEMREKEIIEFILEFWRLPGIELT